MTNRRAQSPRPVPVTAFVAPATSVAVDRAGLWLRRNSANVVPWSLTCGFLKTSN